MLVERFLLTTPIVVDRDAICLIAAACEKLRGGACTVGDLWPGELRSLSTLLSDKILFEKAQKEVWDLIAASRALERLRSSLNAKMHFLQRTVPPAVLHRGLTSIPDEILERILSEILIEMNSQDPGSSFPNRAEYRTKVHDLSLVNRRFRSVVQRIPVLLIDLRGNELSWRSTRLRRRQAHAFIYTGNTFHSRVKSIANNLVILSFDSGAYWTPQAMRPVVQHLPRLEELKLGKCGDFLDSYQLPSLRRLSTSIEAPEAIQLGKVMPQLTHLSITIRISSPNALASIASTLAAGKKLRRLDLRFTNIESIDFRGFVNIRYPDRYSLRLPAVESFKLQVMLSLPYAGSTTINSNIEDEEGQAFTGAISAFLRSFDLPSLGSFDLTCGLTSILDRGNVVHVVQRLISCVQRNGSLRHLSVQVSTPLNRDGCNDLTVTAIQDWLISIPSLQSLTLTNMRITMNDFSFAELAQLRDITMEDCIFKGCTLKDFLIRIFHAPCVNLKSLKLIGMRNPPRVSEAINSFHRGLQWDFYAELTPLDSSPEQQPIRPYVYDSDDDDIFRDRYDFDDVSGFDDFDGFDDYYVYD